jgi:hypothetical protein
LIVHAARCENFSEKGNRMMGVTAIALAMLVGGLYLARRRVLIGLQSRHGPCVPGVVVEADRVFAGHDDVGDSTYDTKLVFTYVVDGREYRGNMLEALPVVLGEEQISKIFERYRPGTSVNVYYDPRHPETSLIEPGLISFIRLGLLVYLGVFIALALHLIFGM